MTALDTRRAPKGEIAARALVLAVVANDDRVERHFLEVKSSLDLRMKKDQAKLAKFILGAANRMPEQAAVAFEGHGVMVVGASGGCASGIPPVEALEIQKAVLPFLGADGPRYDIVRVPCEASDNEVLVLVVDPPVWGQGPFICRRSGDGQLRDGAVFVRADGETREARADELGQLIHRGQVGLAQVNFGVRVIGVVRPVIVDHERTVEEFIARHRSRLLAAMERGKVSEEPGKLPLDPFRPTLGSASFLRMMQSFTTPEQRSESDYLSSVENWERTVRRVWQGGVMRLIGARAQPAEVEVANIEKTFFHDVEVKLHLEGPVWGAKNRAPNHVLNHENLGLPAPPRAWGPSEATWVGSEQRYAIPSRLGSPQNATRPFSRTRWTNSGSVDWSFSVGQLRPREVKVSDDEELVLCTLDPSMASVHGTWEITARDHHDVFSGSLEVEVGDVVDLTPHLRDILGLEGSG